VSAAPEQVVTEAGLLGIHHGLSHFADPDALSYSGAKDILRSPGHYKAKREQKPEQKDAFDLGNAVHYLTLGAGKPLAVVDGNRNATEVKEKIAAARAEGCVVVKSEQMEQAEAISEAIKSHERASRLLSAGDPEVYACRELDGTRVRGWIDWLGPGYVVDLKTCQNAAPSVAAKAMALPEQGGLGYSIQAWVSSWLASDMQATEDAIEELPPFAFVFAETTKPYVVEVYEASLDVLSYGRAWFLRALETFNHCRAIDDWPATYTGQPSTLIGLPRWATTADN
jgi:hypothetical protein